jgi:hypothetical protein
MTPLTALSVPARLAAGIDWGHSVDHTAFSAVGRFALDGPPTFGVVCLHRWPAGYSNRGAIAELAGSGAHLAWVVSERNGLGAPLTDALFDALARRPYEVGGGVRRRVVVVEEDGSALGRSGPPPRPRPLRAAFVTDKVAAHVDGAMKSALYGGLRMMLERGQLLLPASAEALRRELLMVSVELTASGGERIEARTGHDDCADSLALSLRPYRGRHGWRVRLAELAGAGERDDRPRVPVAPTWRSVAGPEVATAEGDGDGDRRRNPWGRQDAVCQDRPKAAASAVLLTAPSAGATRRRTRRDRGPSGAPGGLPSDLVVRCRS